MAFRIPSIGLKLSPTRLINQHRVFSSSHGKSADAPTDGPTNGPTNGPANNPTSETTNTPTSTRPNIGDIVQRESSFREMSLYLADHASSRLSEKQSSNPDDVDPNELSYNQYRFQQGDVYAPNDLSFEAFKMKRMRKKPCKDAFDVLGINPLQEYKNFALLADYVTDMGRIKHSNDTGLRPVNQRRVAKAIRRGVGIGFLPSTHRHPEILKLADTRDQRARSRFRA